jgi:rhodanese-related sulfurtransferase
VNRSWFGQALILLGLAFFPAIGQALYLRETVSWEQRAVAKDEVELPQTQAWGETVLWVDARPDAQFQAAHIPKAIQLNEDRWDELLPQLLAVWSPDKRVVVYCSSESCAASHEVAEKLRKNAGLTNVYVLHGGWETWKAANP